MHVLGEREGVGKDDEWTDKCMLVKFCKSSLFWHYQLVREELEVHVKFKENHFHSQPNNACLVGKSFLASSAAPFSDFLIDPVEICGG